MAVSQSVSWLNVVREGPGDALLRLGFRDGIALRSTHPQPGTWLEQPGRPQTAAETDPDTRHLSGP